MQKSLAAVPRSLVSMSFFEISVFLFFWMATLLLSVLNIPSPFCTSPLESNTLLQNGSDCIFAHRWRHHANPNSQNGPGTPDRKHRQTTSRVSHARFQRIRIALCTSTCRTPTRALITRFQAGAMPGAAWSVASLRPRRRFLKHHQTLRYRRRWRA